MASGSRPDEVMRSVDDALIHDMNCGGAGTWPGAKSIWCSTTLGGGVGVHSIRGTKV